MKHTDYSPAQTPVEVTQGAVNAAEPLPSVSRRGFLKAAPLGALAVVAATPAAAAPVPAPAPAPQVQRGYHETDHIRRYYHSAAYW
jgi:hypothetical protein